MKLAKTVIIETQVIPGDPGPDWTDTSKIDERQSSSND